MKYGIALTGGIATGKSTVANSLRGYGFPVIDSDKISHQVLKAHPEGIDSIFGSGYVVEGEVNRKKLGSYVFANPSELKKLENFLHPMIREIVEQQSRVLEFEKKLYFVDSPLFFENIEYQTLEKSVLVYAPKEIQLARLVGDRELYFYEAIDRIKSQMNIEDKLDMADYTIDNSGDYVKLFFEIKNFVDDINHFFK